MGRAQRNRDFIPAYEHAGQDETGEMSACMPTRDVHVDVCVMRVHDVDAWAWVFGCIIAHMWVYMDVKVCTGTQGRAWVCF